MGVYSGRNMVGACGVGKDGVDVGAEIPVSTGAEELDRSAVVVLGFEADDARLILDSPTREDACSGSHVVFGVAVAPAEHEDFKELSTEVLVRRVAAGSITIEVTQHGTIDENVASEVSEVAKRVAADEVILANHELGTCLVPARSEVSVPEPGHSFMEAGARRQHLIDPLGRQGVPLHVVEVATLRFFCRQCPTAVGKHLIDEVVDI